MLTHSKLKTLLSTEVLNVREEQTMSKILDCTENNRDLGDLDEQTKTFVDELTREYKENQKQQYVQDYVRELAGAKKRKYKSNLQKFKNTPNFDLEKFNKSFDPNFYAAFVEKLKKDTEDESKYVLQVLSKHKYRLSKGSIRLLSGFVTCVVERIVKSGLETTFKKEHRGKGRRVLTREDLQENSCPVGGIAQSFQNVPDQDFVAHAKGFGTSVRKIVANSTEVKVKISATAQHYLCNVVVELLTRLGKIILCQLEERNVKTVSEQITQTTLQSFTLAFGCNFGKNWVQQRNTEEGTDEDKSDAESPNNESDEQGTVQDAEQQTQQSEA